MADYYNLIGSDIITGTNSRDLFYAFTKDPNMDRVRPDAILALLNWNTAMLTAGGTAYRITAQNTQISMDLLLGGDGTDIIYASNVADALFYNNGAIANGFGGFSNIEQFWMGDGDDIVDLSTHGTGGLDYNKDAAVHGQMGNDTIVGGAGKDTLEGDAGDDLIFGWRGSDKISGGTGNDILYGDDLGFNGISGDDVMDGGADNDIMYGGRGNDRMTGGDDNDVLYGQAGGDNMSGGSGDDWLYGDDAGTSSADTLNGDAGSDHLFGGAGTDELYGGSGEDELDGGTGNDYMHGGGGNDTFIAGAGNDVIDGSADVDTLVFGGARAHYAFALQADGSYIATDLRAGSPEGTKTIRNVEFFAFTDVTVPSNALNYAPVITSNGGGASAAVEIDENQTAVTIVAASDVDAGQTVTYSILGGADAAWFTIDSATGVLRFSTAPDFELAGDADGNNIYSVVVAANDGAGGVDTQSLAVTVRNVADGAAPVITSNGGGTTAVVAVAENQLAVTSITATDVDSTSITYAIVAGADAALFVIDATSGALRFRAAPDFEIPLDADRNNIYDVVVQASDTVNADRQALSISVTNRNDNAPLITSYGGGANVSLTVNENVAVAAIVAAQDADRDVLTYSITGGADAASFVIDPRSGQLSFVTPPDYELPGDQNRDRVYEVIVQASDGTTGVAQSFAVAIANVNDNAPVITSNGGGAAAAISIAENGTAVTRVIAVDADGTTPAYTIGGGADAQLFTIDAITGALAFLSAPDFERRFDADGDGIYQVIVQASDGTNVTSQLLSISITDIAEGGRTITGSSGNNTFSPTTAVAAYQTTALNDTIFGLAGNDVIDGGLGADYMDGGIGNDTYHIDTFSDDGFVGNDDQAIELAGAGTDIAYSSVSYRLAANLENLTLIGAAMAGYGNDLANTITGNAAANRLEGGDGNDRLYGGDQNDTLIGGAGNDLHDGGTGADAMAGGLGDDTYYIDAWSDDGNAANDDLVTELAGEGADTVIASVTYTLTAEVERLTLAGTSAIDGRGNDLANTIAGNSANNVLWGGLGGDTLTGGGGNDTLYGEDGLDTLDGGAGNDRLIGGAGADTLQGKAGIDVLSGGAGRDTLTGGTEADTFVFAFGDTTLNSSSFDKITDFRSREGDVIDLGFVNGALSPSSYAELAIGTNLFADALSAARLTASAGQVTFVAGTTDGWLFFDGNGDGALDQAVLLSGVNSLAGFDHLNVI